jgi:hypothetical protein
MQLALHQGLRSKAATQLLQRRGEIAMKSLRMLPMLLVLATAAAGGAVQAQPATVAASAPLTRTQVKMETAEFLKSHRWDVVAENWVLKSEVEAPAGKTRAEIRAETSQFLRTSRWDEPTGSWAPLKGQPRDLSTLTRAQIRAETAQFMRTHRFDDATQTWLDLPPARKK